MYRNCLVRVRCLELLFLLVVTIGLFSASLAEAANVKDYSDTISDSRPEGAANHTFKFTLTRAVAAGAVLEIKFPSEFAVASNNFSARNVEMLVNGSARQATSTASLGIDRVSITAGSGGRISYELNPGSGLPAGTPITLRVGNHTSAAVGPYTSFSSSTGTTTYAGDALPVTNSENVGSHTIDMSIKEGSNVAASAGFVINVIRALQAGPGDTTETIPPFRFNAAPTSTVGGTTQFVEISLNTDEFAWCSYASTPGIDYTNMSNEFTNTGLVVHSTIVPVTRGVLNTFYIRCIDDEGNINSDDYLIAFPVQDEPTGQSNTEGDTFGDGTGSGNDGTGDGSGSGGTTGDSDGEADTTGGSEGDGGSGGGGGGGSGGGAGGGSAGGLDDSGDFASGDAEVTITGLAPANSTITILVDGKLAETGRSDASGRYSVTISEIARGAYTFGIYAEDNNDARSTTVSTSFTVSGGRTSRLSNINVTPTILITPDPVDIGATVTWSGKTFPDALVTIQHQRDGQSSSRESFTANANSAGEWSYQFDTAGLRADTYQLRTKAEVSGTAIATDYSDFVNYGIGQEAVAAMSADLNRDGRVNLTDFSILLFWWGSAGGDSNPPADINRDGSVNLTDFSILLFNWSG